MSRVYWSIAAFAATFDATLAERTSFVALDMASSRIRQAFQLHILNKAH
jgi:hypothetical protein